MKWAVLGGSLLLLVGSVRAGNDVDIYVKDGALRTTLIVRDVQILPTGFVGLEYKIDTDGKWTVSQYIGKKPMLKSKGTLPREYVEDFAKQLARFDLLSLRSYGKAALNTRVVGVEFGRVNALLALPGGQQLPRPDAGDSATLAERYAGIVQATHEVITRRR